MKKVFKYLRELSVVVAGIAITFTVSNWIGSCGERKTTERYLRAVRLELEENLKMAKEKEAFYDQTWQMGLYLRSGRPEQLNADSLRRYDDVMWYCFTVTFRTSAFELLESSGIINNVRDEALLSAIMESYALLAKAKYGSDRYMDRKLNEIFDVSIDNGSSSSLLVGDARNITDTRLRKLLNFYTIHVNVEDVMADCVEHIENALLLFPANKK